MIVLAHRVLPDGLERAVEEEYEDSDLGEVIERVDELNAPELRLTAHHRNHMLANGRT